MLVSAETPFCLADIHVVPLTLTLSQGTASQQIQQKPMEVLCYLASQYPALVTREQLIDAVWDGNVYVGEKALTNTIWQLRQALTPFGQADLIATVRKKGYRLQQAPQLMPAAVQIVSADSASAAAVIPPHPRSVVKKSWSYWRWSGWHWSGWIVAVVILCGSLLYWGWPAPAPGLSQITRQQGWSMFPTVTPDGRYLVYSWQHFGQPADLFFRDLQQPDSAARQLTFTPLDELRPVISSDGQTLYYSSKSPVDGRCQIHQISLQTLQEKILQTCGRHGDVYLDLSADNRYLYFNGSRDAAGRSWYQLDLQQATPKAEPMPCHDNCEQRVRDIAVQPDGPYIALTRRANRLSEEVFLYDQQTGRERQLTAGQSDIRGIAWSSDGRQLIYSTENNGRSLGFVLDIHSGKQTAIAVDDMSFVSRVTTDNLLFFHRDSSVPQLGYVPLHTASAIFPLSAGDLSYQAPDFHQGRAQLVYLSNENGSSELWLADRQLLQKQQLTRLNGVIKYPRWSHRGDRVLFVSRSANSLHDRLTILDVATGKLSFPDTGMQVHGRPGWTSDDQAVLLPEQGKLMRFDLQNGHKEAMTQSSGNYAQMPDERGFYYTKGRGQGIWWQALQQGQPTGAPLQIINGEAFSESYSWLATPTQIFYLQAVKDGVEVWVMQLANKQHRRLVVLPAGQTDLAANLAYDETGQRLLLQYSPVPRIDIWRWQLP
ncbi:MAG: winged helix-turn-helix domain-containing protein [Rheinheimera sp.]|nr:winged helix-turn-helix domain-containing protein [Rheinheimera sp.]